ncbi:hypothetical protein J4H92_08165 [Leucobacter weissii]|uniref:Uncharacterized protein n=1 Tax=Leucobacter weissii TaxID=1983706 RepID=A0A939MN84_9MICO|nr:hypothetical protein [Leucobacter weissii]MBO1901922.1 hypothetical protein [Leucobacter weissii]
MPAFRTLLISTVVTTSQPAAIGLYSARVRTGPYFEAAIFRECSSPVRLTLEAERLKRVHAHDADAIPVDLRKSGQDRMHDAIAEIGARLDRLHERYADA